MRRRWPLNAFHRVCVLGVAAWLTATASSPAADPVRALVVFSDGEAAEGMMRVIGSRSLTLVPAGERRQRMIRLDDIRRIDHRPEAERMERPWTFRESGKHDKIFFDGEYPLLNFTTTVELVDGRRLTGHLISVALELRPGATGAPAAGRTRTRKVFLKRQMRGKVGEGMEALVYPRTIRFPDHGPVTAKRLRGTVTGFGRLLQVNVCDLDREQMIRASVGEGTFDAGRLLPGRYDVTVLTERAVLTGFAPGGRPGVASGELLTESDRAAVERLFPLADDFFRERRMVVFAGDSGHARALVYKRRADYHDAQRLTPGGWLWHLEAWVWHRAQDQWKLDRRLILMRHRQQGGEPVRPLVRLAALEAVAPGQAVVVTAKGAADGVGSSLDNLD